MGGGIARWMEALADHARPGSLTVSTGTVAGGPASDTARGSRVDRITTASHRLRTLQGLSRWCARAVVLTRPPATRFSWCGTVRPAIYPAAAARTCNGVPYGVIVHGSDLVTLRRRIESARFKRVVMRRLLRGASVFVANSSWTAARARELLADLAIDRPVRVVPLGTDPVRFSVSPDTGRRFRAARALPEGQWLVTVARLVPHKGIDMVLAALASLASSHPRLRYAIIGTGADHARLDALVTSLGIRDRVHFLSDVDDDELPSAYAMGDIYVGLSRQDGVDVEGFGISLLEAASCGLPVIAGASGGTSDAVADQVTGLLVDPRDSAAIAAAVSGLLDDPTRAGVMGAAGRRRIEREYTWARVAHAMDDIAEEYGRR